MVREPWSLSATGLKVAASAVAISVLRVQRGNAAVAGALGEAFQLRWPVEPNTVACADPRVAWMAPGTWAIFQSAARIQGAIEAACGDQLFHLGDVSAGRRLWHVEGGGSRDLIARGCSIDTHPSVFSAGRCAQTLFAQVPILLMAGASMDSFDIVADASFAGHLQAWFLDALQGDAA